MDRWMPIDDLKVRHFYQCPECNNGLYVHPEFFTEMGVPVCTDCVWDDEMDYIRTEISTT
jgi:hypothetical protein